MEKISTVEINNSLYLNFVPVRTSSLDYKPPTLTNSSYIFLIDRSGSMYSNLNRLIDDIQKVVEKLNINDLFSFGYFSSEGIYDFPIKGFKIAEESDRDKIKALLSKHRQTIGLTCFSEILNKTEEVISDLKTLCSRQAVWLLTDGYPVVSNEQKEEKLILESGLALSKLADLVYVIGYGDYYNVELLERFARNCNGVLIHSDSVGKVADQTLNFVEKTQTMGPSQVIEVDIPARDLIKEIQVFEVSDKDITPVFSSMEDSKLTVELRSDSPETTFCFFTSSPVSVSKAKDADYKSFAIASYALSVARKTEDALCALAKTKDRYLFNKLLNSFTVSEIGESRELIKEAVTSESLRYKSGKVEDLKFDLTTPSVVDVLEFLDNEDALLRLDHSSFKYKSIGGSPKPEPGYPKFVLDQESLGIPIKNLIWHTEYLNLSVQCNYRGYIELPEKGRKAHGLPRIYKTSKIRTYTIIRNGALAVTKLPVEISAETEDRLKTLLGDDLFYDVCQNTEDESIKVLHLDQLTMVNKAMIEKNQKAEPIAEAQLRLLKLQVKSKVLRGLLKERESFSFDDESLTPEQEDYLKSLGLSKWAYNPPTQKTKVVDELDFYTFTIKPKTRGYASIPSLAEGLKAIESGKAVSGTKEWLVKEIQHYTYSLENLSNEAQVQFLKNEIELIKKEEKILRQKIDRFRLSLVLSRSWFTDVCEIEIDGITFSLELKTKKQPISVPVES